MDIKSEVLRIKDEVIELRRSFHEYPELGYREYATREKIIEFLTELGCSFVEMPKTGVCAILEGSPGGKTVLLRADMDALPIQEETGLRYASKNPGVMHACGHDGHIAIQLGAAKILAAHRDILCGTVKLMFQPNEEEAGALDMIEAGILENPRVDAAFALHLWSPIQSGHLGLQAGPVLGTTEEFELEIIGKAGHTAMPHEARYALSGASAIIEQLPGILRNAFNPLYPMAILFGKVHSGQARNVISDRVELGGTLRFLFPDEKRDKPLILDAFDYVVKEICRTRGLEYKLAWIPSNPSLYNDRKLVEIVSRSADTVFGGDGIDDIIEEFKSLAGEDFAEISQRVPSVMTFIGIRNEAKASMYPHHHAQFDIDEDMLIPGVELQVRNVFEYLNGKGLVCT
jgi:amidohydrolase